MGQQPQSGRCRTHDLENDCTCLGRGDGLIQDHLTTEPHASILVYAFHVGLVKLTWLLGVDPRVTYHLTELVARATFDYGTKIREVFAALRSPSSADLPAFMRSRQLRYVVVGPYERACQPLYASRRSSTRSTRIVPF
jgi:hypothetical protein